MFQKTRKFVNEVKVELAKASWPWDPKLNGVKKYRELIDSTVVVIIAMLLLGAFVSMFDFVVLTVLGALVRL